MQRSVPPSSRRKTNSWDPIYDPSVRDFQHGSWKSVNSPANNLKKKTSYREVFTFEKMHSELGLKQQNIVVFRDHSFFECDFNGFLHQYSQAVFKNCNFVKCDFGLSWLDGVKFSKCAFSRCSFSQCDLNGSEFRKTSWSNIWYSGNETKLNDSYITNPDDFLYSIFRKPRDIEETDKVYNERAFRILATQATASRALLISLKKYGSEGEFYKAVRAYEVYQGSSRIAEAKVSNKNLLRLFRLVQSAFIRFFGWTNDWGKNPLRPLLLLLVLCASFVAVYTFLFPNVSLLEAMERSFNLSVLAGYAVESKASENYDVMRTMQAIQFLSSLILYTSFFATLVGRLSRVKQ